ncbi:Rossmann-fold NAD(P)-binding domain-containing protein [Albibacterium bauzanense]|uniref:N-succinylornithine carbamoyltransferase n=1 Tax=Albibacterium bauzanense TaxID=653929 RepID=A0A4R1LVR2_9SPHI|nr:acetylornithine carbamoyltransferase [Albibacterium bauzanense]TCK82942.1 ornithine carbamoyltransferase [Albibacterium bauzanense]
MKKFFSVKDVPDLRKFISEAKNVKANPFGQENLGKHKTLGLIFLNPSLRTRLSTQKAGLNLGMQVMVMNMGQEGWALETKDGVVMDGTSVEHIREAAAVIGQYCDIVGLRSFPSLKDREADYTEELFNKFMEFCKVPVVSLESATRHPLQSFADLLTIEEEKKVEKPKVVLTWAPHVKALPQAVPNSFAEWMNRAQKEGMIDFIITHPKGYELSEEFTEGVTITHNQSEAIKDADFVYVKNWSGFQEYGKIIATDEEWMLNSKRLSNHTKVMHCLPVRRDVELASEILDGPQSLVQTEAGNRLWAAQTVLKTILEDLS